MEKKYEILENDFITYKGRKLYRIKALRDITIVKEHWTVSEGDLGGYVEGYHNLSQKGSCWIFDDSKVYSNAKIEDNAIVKSVSEVYGNAVVKDDVIISQSEVYDNARIIGCTLISLSKIHGNASLGKIGEIPNLSVIDSDVRDNANVISSTVNMSEIYDNAKVNGEEGEDREVVYRSNISNNSIICHN